MASSSRALATNGSSSKPGHPVTRVAIRNNVILNINDHIYITAPWAPGAGEPFLIARVMEFVTAQSSRNGAAALASSSGTLQVRANVFLRMRDISHKVSNDPRLLVATMYSDVFALENVRGLCEVRHRELIGDAPEVSAWKKKEDHFYYYQLYDRYIHRFYDVIPTDKIRNAPPEVLTALRQRYSFVVAEVGMQSDLCDSLRGCASCHRWAASAESVRCDTCKKFFHMKCLTPPLASKPAKGYSWTCAPCSRTREQAIEFSGDPGGTIENGSDFSRAASSAAATPTRGGAAAGAGRGRGRGRGRGGYNGLGRNLLEDGNATESPGGTPGPEKNNDDRRGTRCYNGWPYRYFGQHTEAKDILDPHDSIYPRATTRLGSKFQATLLTWEEQQELGLGVHTQRRDREEAEAAAAVAALPMPDVQTAPKKNKPGRPPKRKREDETPHDTPTMPTMALPPPEPVVQEFERGTQDSVDVIWEPIPSVPWTSINAYLTTCRTKVFTSIPPSNVDLINRALSLMVEHNNPVMALQMFSKSTVEQLRLVHWTAKEQRVFEETLNDGGADIKALKRAIPTKPPHAIVRHFYAWKNEKLKKEADKRREELEKSGKTAVALEPEVPPTRAVSPSLSLFGDAAAANSSCVMCNTSQSLIWYKGPYSWQNRYLCVNCGLYWRKYAAESSHTELQVQTRKQLAQAEESALGVSLPITKISKVNKRDSVKPTTPPPVVAVKKDSLKCVLCRRLEPKRKLQQCSQCTLSVHQGCYGLTDEELAAEVWHCEACANEKSLDACLVPRCVLCPPPALPPTPPPEPTTARGKGKGVANGNLPQVPSEPLAALDAVKPTEGNHWAHVVCAAFMPEIVYTDPVRMRLVEGVGNLPWWRFASTCDICHQRSGACVSCADPTCKKTLHVSCAWEAQPQTLLGFEITPVKSTRRDVVPTAAFKTEKGNIQPLVWCKQHKAQGRTKKLYDLSEVDHATGLTLLQTLARTHKAVTSPGMPATVAAASDESYALLRRARRYDITLSTAGMFNQGPKPISVTGPLRNAPTQPAVHGYESLNVEPLKLPGRPRADASRPATMASTPAPAERAEPAVPKKQCARCASHFSPYWWHWRREGEADEAEQSQPQPEASQDEAMPAADGMEVDAVAAPPKRLACIVCAHELALVNATSSDAQ